MVRRERVKHNIPHVPTDEQTRPDESSDTLLSLLSEASDPADFQLMIEQWQGGLTPRGREGGHKNCPKCN